MTWYVMGSTRGFFAAQFGAKDDCTAPGDYDGDLKFDFAVQRPCGGATDPAVFYILKTTDSALLMTATEKQTWQLRAGAME